MERETFDPRSTRIVTLSRDYGAGGAEVAAKIAAVLGWELLDRELLHQAAELEHLPDAELERLDEHEIGLLDRFRLHPPHERYLHGLREAAKQAAARGNVVLVGRGVRELLGDAPNALHVRLVAPRSWRATRMAHREGWPAGEAEARIAAVDKTRERFLRYFFGAGAAEPARFDFIVNTARVSLDDVVAATVTFLSTAKPEGESSSPRGRPEKATSPIGRPRGLEDSPSGLGGKEKRRERRIVTLSRELGAWATEFAPRLARALDLHVYDRELVEEESRRLGVPETQLRALDEHAVGVAQRLMPGSLYHQYVDAMGPVMREIAKRSPALIVGRGGNRLLRDDPAAFHVRLVATHDFRLRRVMQYHWMREDPARNMLDGNDSIRRRFFEHCFGAHWADPLEYHLILNTGRLGESSVGLGADLARRHWGRLPATEARP
jgi:cytidylate kinase